MTSATCGSSGRTYSTLALAETGIPSPPTGGHTINCYNDSEFTGPLVVDGNTTSASDFIVITAAAGESFQDHASVRTNPLFYDQSKGVGIAGNPFAAELVEIKDPYVTFSRLQVKRTAQSYTTTTTLRVQSGHPSNTILIKDCIFAKAYNGVNPVVVSREQRIVNCVIYDSGTGASFGLQMTGLGQVINCTIVKTVTAASTGTFGTTDTGNDPPLFNCAVFGWNTSFGGTTGASSRNCATDQTTVPNGSNHLASLNISDQLESQTADMRIKSTSNLVDAGEADATYSPADISGTTRGTSGDADIGAWEIVVASGQPAGKRMGGVPFTRNIKGVW
jgi:hypothetical protein